MKKVFVLVAIISFTVNLGFSQKSYWSIGSEMIFSFADIDKDGDKSGNIMRWAPVINLQGIYNYNPSNKFGLFTGIGVRNVGYIYDNYTDEFGDVVKKKFRTYNLAVPVGIKIGNMKKAFLFGGYEVELPFQYKEKTFKNDSKDKFTAWFTDRVEIFQHAVIAGIQLPYGTSVKFKYYFSSFHNTNYSETNGGVKTYPYAGLNANVFYFSLNFNLFTPLKVYTDKKEREEYY